MSKEILLYIPAIVVSALTGVILYLTEGNLVFAIIPGVIFMVLVVALGLSRVVNEERVLVAFVFLAFVVDDISVRSWQAIDTVTKVMGNLLYETFLGLNGMETSAALFVVWLLLTQKAGERTHWLRLGLIPILALTFLVMGVCFLSAIHGLSTGGTIKTLFIQTRFMHLLPLWTLVGFIMVSRAEYANKLLKTFALVMIFKGFQGVFVYLMHRSYFLEADYLLNHFASGLWVAAFAYWVNHVAHLNLSWPQKLWRFALLLPVIVCYILNNRRTAIIGVGLASFALLFLLPREWLKKQVKKLVVISIVLPLFIGATWNSPKNGLGFISNTFKSLLFSDKEIVDSRNIENYNLYRTVIDNPLFGLGISKEYPEYMQLPSMEEVYTRDQIMPHNGILFFWTYNGPLGMAAVGTLFAFIIGTFGTLVRRKGDVNLFLVGTTSLFLSVEYLAYTFGDMSFQNNACQCLVGLMFGGTMRILAELRKTEARVPCVPASGEAKPIALASDAAPS